MSNVDPENPFAEYLSDDPPRASDEPIIPGLADPDRPNPFIALIEQPFREPPSWGPQFADPGGDPFNTGIPLEPLPPDRYWFGPPPTYWTCAGCLSMQADPPGSLAFDGPRICEPCAARSGTS